MPGVRGRDIQGGETVGGDPTAFILDKRDEALLRVIGMGGVILLHSIYAWVETYHGAGRPGPAAILAALLDQATRFTVPLFLFLSGYGLGLRYRDRPCRPLEFWRHRLPKLAAPFLCWSLLTSFRHLAFFRALPWSAHPAAALGRCADFLFVRGFDYQYYFVILLFQFYLAFPFLHRLATSRAWLWAFLALHLALLSPAPLLWEALGMRLAIPRGAWLLWYGFYCYAGVYASRRPDFLGPWLRAWGWRRCLAAWGLAYGLLCAEFLLSARGNVNLRYVDHFNRWSVWLYCLACLLLYAKLRPRLAAGFHRGAAAAWLRAHVAPFTFFAFFAHTHLLRLWEPRPGGWGLGGAWGIWEMAARSGLALAGSFALAWAVQARFRHRPGILFALGLPDPAEAPVRPSTQGFRARGLRRRLALALRVRARRALEAAGAK